MNEPLDIEAIRGMQMSTLSHALLAEVDRIRVERDRLRSAVLDVATRHRALHALTNGEDGPVMVPAFTVAEDLETAVIWS